MFISMLRKLLNWELQMKLYKILYNRRSAKNMAGHQHGLEQLSLILT